MHDDEKIFNIKDFIWDNYSIDVDAIEKVKGSYKIFSNDKIFCLKVVKYEFSHSYFILSAMNHLKRKGFADIPSFIPNNWGGYYSCFNGNFAYLTEWIASRLSNYDNPIELSLVSTELAKIHKYSEGFIIRDSMKPRIGWFSWIEVFNTRKNELLDFDNRIKQKANKSELDLLYHDSIKNEIVRSQKSIDRLRKNKYIEVMEKEVFKSGFCHHDYANHNILLTKTGKIKIIDFDYCILDSHLHDLSSLLIRAMKNGKWDFKKANNILYSYQKIYDIRKEEIPIIREFIRFPQEFWQIGIQIYWEQQPWGEDFFLRKLQRYLSDIKYRNEFIDSYFEGGD